MIRNRPGETFASRQCREIAEWLRITETLDMKKVSDRSAYLCHRAARMFPVIEDWLEFVAAAGCSSEVIGEAKKRELQWPMKRLDPDKFAPESEVV